LGPRGAQLFRRRCRDRCGEHPERHLAGHAGILPADACAGFNTVYKVVNQWPGTKKPLYAFFAIRPLG
jgi:hypothetical protein